MDVHRCRFVPYPPSAINALAFSHTTGTTARSQPLRLAIGRANGDIEIWDPCRGAWIHEITCRGGRGRSVEALVWTCDPDDEDADGFITRGRLRLFSIGYSSAITEWDLYTGLPLRESSGSLSEVWCIAAQPRWGPKKNKDGGVRDSGEEDKWQRLVAGCADGTLVLLSTTDASLTFEKYLARPSKKKARTLSLAFQNRYTVAAGFADSSIRVYDIRNGSLIRNMSLGGGPQGGPKEKLVWALECLPDGTLVSGDSTGEVVFWDARTYGQLQRLQGHNADVLCLTSSGDGKTVFSGGMDRRTVVYSLTTTSSGPAQRRLPRWTETAHRRFHEHDVKAMARFDSAKMSVIVSGGLDTRPVLVPLRNFGTEYHHALSFTPHTPPVTGAGRCIVAWWGTQVSIYRIVNRRRKSQIPPAEANFAESETPNFRTVAQIELQGDESIASASISPRGTLLAISTSRETKLFGLRPRTSGPQRGTLKIAKLETTKALATTGARLVLFSPDAKWLLCVSLNNTVTLHRVVYETATTTAVSNVHITNGSIDGDTKSLNATPSLLPEFIRLHRPRRSPHVQNGLNGSWGSYERTITRAAFSADGRILAISDLGGGVDTWVLEGNEDPDAPRVDIATRASEGSHDGSGSESDSDGNSDDSDDRNRKRSRRKTIVYHGQHWAPNPQGHMLPRLPAAPIVLSFRSPPLPLSGSLSNGKHLVNGNPGIHATRHNPHAHSHTLPSPATTGTDGRLFVLTATHSPYEFDVLKGGMTAWSRKQFQQPSSGKSVEGDKKKSAEKDTDASLPSLPPELKLQRDRAVGCVWDIKEGQWARAWLYGAAWLGMVDLGFSRDVADLDDTTVVNGNVAKSQAQRNGASESEVGLNSKWSKKRKRGQEEDQPSGDEMKFKSNEEIQAALATQRHTTGAAGSRMVANEMLSGGVLMLKNDGSVQDGEEMDWVDLSAGVKAPRSRTKPDPNTDEDEDDNDDDDESDSTSSSSDPSDDNPSDSDLANAGMHEPPIPTTKPSHTLKPHPSHTKPTDPRRPTNARRLKTTKHLPPRTSYITNRYRPILGVLPLTTTPASAAFDAALETDGEDDEPELGELDRNAEEERVLEVALLERPLWDLDLPARFVGKHEK